MSESTDTRTAHQRVWFVTGSSRGLGRALITAILDAGDLVA
ncbi:short-chain dehydrogenase/reductase, partial [Streptomyces nigra]